jgi:hypothetical protein
MKLSQLAIIRSILPGLSRQDLTNLKDAVNRLLAEKDGLIETHPGEDEIAWIDKSKHKEPR